MSNTNDLLFELGTEELPPVTLKKLSDALTSEFIKGLENANLSHGEVESFAAPRRLAVLIKDCAVSQADRDIEKRGPAVQAAFDKEGNPSKAAEGFARSCGTTFDKLDRLKTDKGEWLVFKSHQKGSAAETLLPEIAQNALNKLPIAKRMRWGESTAQFVRPVQWLVFIHGENIIPCTLLDAEAGRQTYGHRFHHPEAITLTSPSDYSELLRDTGKVIAHFETRKATILEQVKSTADALNCIAEIDEKLLDEVTGLNEWPQPIEGSFEEVYLEIPHEALIATMKTNQKYFPLFNKDGTLANRFITIANVESTNPQLIREGNERVVRPRLSDAMFFWQQDGKTTLEALRPSLDKVVFQKQLGNMAEKSVRVADLAQTIAAQIDGDETLAHRAGLLSRCDLMTEIVNEFASMQGIMGRYQAKRDGEHDEIAAAMDEFYMPRFSGDQLPQTKTGIAISLAEKLDTLIGIFGIGMKPTGVKDPFALRRAALGALRIMREHSLTLNLNDLLTSAEYGLRDKITEEKTVTTVYDFMIERLKGLFPDTAADTFAAVASVKPESVADFDQRLVAVSAFRKLDEAEALAAANKRIRNILKKSPDSILDDVDSTLFSEAAENTLLEAINDVENTINPLLENSDYQAALKGMASLREPVDNFFDNVMVMADDPKIKSNRLTLLNRLSQLFLRVADISLLQA